MAVALVSGQATADPSGTATFSSAPTAGNCLVACVQAYGATSITKVTTGSNADNWAQALALSGSGQVIAVWTCPGLTKTNTSVTFTASGSTISNIQAYEFSGLGNAPAVDVSQTHLVASSPGTGWTTNATRSAASGDLLIGLLGGNTSSFLTIAPAGSPWTSQSATVQRVSGQYAGIVSGYQAPGSSGTVTYTATASTTLVAYGGIAIAFTPGSSGGGGGGSTAGSFLSFF